MGRCAGVRALALKGAFIDTFFAVSRTDAVHADAPTMDRWQVDHIITF